jgi:hypothetical protein
MHAKSKQQKESKIRFHNKKENASKQALKSLTANGPPQQRFESFVTIKEAWMLHLLHHLSEPVAHLVPPSPSFVGLGASDLATRYLGYTPSGTLVPDRLNFLINKELDTSSPSMHRFGDTRQLDYLPVTAKTYTTLTLTGNKGAWIWFDPLEIASPLRINTGPVDQAYWVGALRSTTVGSRYPNVSSTSLQSRAVTWSPGFDPTTLIPTEWNNIEGIAAESSYYKVDLYPIDYDYDSDLQGLGKKAIEGYASNYIRWVCGARLVVSVANPTAFSSTGMRVRTRDSTLHRFSERVEDPLTGDYGFTGPFVQSEMAEAIWKGSSWAVPTKFYQHEESNPFEPMPPVDDSSFAFEPIGVANWHSLQRSLELMVPVIEVVQNTDSETRAVELSIELIVDYCLVPVSGSTGLMSSQSLTFPARLPHWYQPLSYTGAVYPLSSSDCARHSTVSFLRPALSQLSSAPIQALRMDTSSNRAIQHLAIRSQESPQAARAVLSTIRDTGKQASAALRAAGEAVADGYNFGRMLKSIGSKVWSGIKALGGVAARNLPMIEEVGSTALLL